MLAASWLFWLSCGRRAQRAPWTYLRAALRTCRRLPGSSLVARRPCWSYSSQTIGFEPFHRCVRSTAKAIWRCVPICSACYASPQLARHVPHPCLRHVFQGLSALVTLTRLVVDSNLLRELPEVVLGLPSLVVLQASSNSITHLPDDLYRMESLQALMVSGNQVCPLLAACFVHPDIRQLCPGSAAAHALLHLAEAHAPGPLCIRMPYTECCVVTDAEMATQLLEARQLFCCVCGATSCSCATCLQALGRCPSYVLCQWQATGCGSCLTAYVNAAC